MDLINKDKKILLIIIDNLESYDCVFDSLSEEFTLLKSNFNNCGQIIQLKKNLLRENILVIIHQNLNEENKKDTLRNFFLKKSDITNPHFLIINTDIQKIVNSTLPDNEQIFYYDFNNININENSFYLYVKMIFLRMKDITRLENYIINSFRTIIDAEIMKRQKTEIEKLYKELETLSEIDYLTKVLNRRAFFNKLEKDLFNPIDSNNKFKRKDDHIKDKLYFSCIMIDIDYFKKVNDTHGHLSGDNVLKKLGNLLRSKKIFRSNDIIGRYGGEEFIVILHKSTSRESKIPAERLRNEIKNIDFKNEKGDIFNINISIGISEYKTNDKFSADIINRADKALYYAKQHGRDQTIMYEEIFDN